ncbi:MAG: hypothetical protein Q7S20_05005 [Gemmatimonadaceae bacterium]|nr:hypothetical protein [Gemmatimonadaceae bacterium]
MIPAALLCVILSGCADQQPTGPKLQPTGPKLPSVARTDNVPFNKFFVAWSRNYSSSPIQTQNFALDTRLNRQFGGLWPEQPVLDFARANPGRLYINGDEPDQYCIPAYEYAGIYHYFVTTVRGADPTARFSPAGFAEPNDRCCPEPVEEPCRVRMHSVGYADQFYSAYVQRFGAAPSVDEWRFHDFGLPFDVGDVDGWWSRVDKLATWSVSHGANMVLGAWAFHRWKISAPQYQEYLKQAMGRLMRDPRINEAVYWSYESWAGEANYLANEDGSLTPAGQTYANPLTDIPTGLKVVGSADGQAKLRWNNTTAAWGAEAEFWVQAPGSDSFVYHKTELVAGPGASQTPFVDFRIGDLVRARVRYHNVYGQAAWSDFSNTVLLALTEPDGDTRSGVGKRPLFCFSPLC